MPSVRKIMVIVFWEHKDTLLVNVLDHGNTVAAEHYSRCHSSPSVAEDLGCYDKVS
jgi:hypothetical protein